MAATNAEEVHLVFPRERYKELQEVLFPDDETHPFAGKYERGVFCVVSRSTGARRVSYLVREIVHPTSADDLELAPRPRAGKGEFESSASTAGATGEGASDLGERMGHYRGYALQFSEDYHHRAIERACAVDAGLLRVHTHPGGVRPSPVDRASAERVFDDDVDRLHPGAPLLAGITNEAGEWSARVYEFGSAEASVTPATAVRLVGPVFEKRETHASPLGPAGARGRINEDEQDSSIQMWGEEGQKILAGLRIGVVGCGGVGSILAPHLARFGIGQLVLVDFDRLEAANENRAGGAEPIDIRLNTLKTRVAEREAHHGATAPDFETVVVDGSVVDDAPEYAGVPALLDCDIIIAAVDAHRPRKVLDHLASVHCIPVISGGSRLYLDEDGMLAHETKVEVAATGPGWPCFDCQRVWRPEEVEHERDDPRFRGERVYVAGGVDPDDEPRSMSVIGINDMVVGQIFRRLKGIVLGVTSRVVGTIRINPRDMEIDWHSTLGCEDECGRPPLAAGDRYELPVGTDWSMRYERADIPMPEPQTITEERAREILDSMG